MFIDRTPRDDDPWLRLKVGSFILGAVLALGGMALDLGWLVWVAVAVLLVGFAARFFPDPGPEEEDGAAPGPD